MIAAQNMLDPASHGIIFILVAPLEQLRVEIGEQLLIRRNKTEGMKMIIQLRFHQIMQHLQPVNDQRLCL